METELRYVLGPSFNVVKTSVSTAEPAPAVETADMNVGVVEVTQDGLALDFSPPAATVAVPSEVRVYLYDPESDEPEPIDAVGYLASSIPVAVTPVSMGADGGRVFVAHPDVPDGGYIGQVVIGYPK